MLNILKIIYEIMFDKLKITKGFMSDIEKQKEEYSLQLTNLENLILQEVEQLLSETKHQKLLKQDNHYNNIYHGSNRD